MRDPAESLAFHATSPSPGVGYVLLLERPDADGRVRTRRWESPDYTAAAREEELTCAELRKRVAREALEGWRFTMPPQRILAWLDAG